MGKPRVPPPARKHGPAKGEGKGDAKGPGWGGPAKGPGNGSPPSPIQQAHAVRRDPEAMSLAALKTATREVRIAAVKEMLLGIVIDGTTEANKLAAIREFLNREEGLPVARNVNLNADDADKLTIVVRKFFDGD